MTRGREKSEQTTTQLPSTARVLAQLIRPVLRALPVRALGATAAVALLIAALPRLLSDEPDPWSALVALRAAALTFALGLAFVLDDPTRDLTSSVPTRRILRTTLRVALVAPFAVAWWTAAVLLIPSKIRPPVGDMTLEAAAAAVLSLAAAATALRFTTEPEPGQRVAAGFLVVALVSPLALPNDWGMYVSPPEKQWGVGHDHWAMLLVGAAAVWAACGPEPVRRRLLGRRTRVTS
ncbi:ABC transporter [Streptomyces sp. NPDC013161]|uniref:ABC transporter n=1 Tax=Streptomyces sp. NPDC013161 TaxID=3364862 RepID=UPI0036CE0AD5